MVFNLLLAILVVAAGLIVFELAVLSGVKSSNAWVKALPALVPFSGFVAVLLFSSSKETWFVDLARRTVEFLRKSRVTMAIAVVATTALALAMSWYTWRAVYAKEGYLVVRVIQKNDVPGDAVPDIPVIVEQQLPPNTVDIRRTAKDGRAIFEVDGKEIFTVRIRRSATNDDEFIVKSNTRVDASTKASVELVRLADIPRDAWIEPKRVPPGLRPEAPSTIFAQLPEKYLQWRSSIPVGVRQAEPANFQAQFPFPMPPAEMIVTRAEFSVGFSPLLRLPRWVAYTIVPGGMIQRDRDVFLPDPLIPAAFQASGRDYSFTGYDRGHLVRRQDLFGLGREATLKIFYLSAVVPQIGYVNRKTWVALETIASNQAAAANAKVHVLRGPIFAAEPGRGVVDLTLMGPNQIPVPTHFYQILRIESPAGVQTIAHVVPNRYVAEDERDVSRFASTVARIRELTGLPFDSM